MKTTTLSESQILRKGDLIEAVFRRPSAGGGVEMWVRSAEIHKLFSSLPEKEPGAFHKIWKLPLFSPKILPEVSDCTFDSPFDGFLVMDPGKGGLLANLTFLRARTLHEGITIPLTGLVNESDLLDMRRTLQRASVELFRSYMDTFEVHMKVTYEEASVA